LSSAHRATFKKKFQLFPEFTLSVHFINTNIIFLLYGSAAVNQQYFDGYLGMFKHKNYTSDLIY